VYASDLADLPRNPWSLRGLQQVYQAQATPAAAEKLEQVGEGWQSDALLLLLPLGHQSCCQVGCSRGGSAGVANLAANSGITILTACN
jgi:hypothetical protein